MKKFPLHKLRWPTSHMRDQQRERRESAIITIVVLIVSFLLTILGIWAEFAN